MSYGLSVTNNYGSVVISSEYKVMVYSERGTFSVQSQYTDKEGHGFVTFIHPILTQEAPQIFLRYVSGAHADLGLYITMVGSAGNWTGFKITSAVRNGSSLQNYLIEYVSCKYADQPNASRYGMEICDANGHRVFSSSDRVVRYSKFAKNWTFIAGNFVDIYDSGLIIDSDDFICVSTMDRGVMWFADHSNYAGITMRDGGVPVLKISNDIRTQGGYWYYQGMNGTSFGISVCKFPIARYYN